METVSFAVIKGVRFESFNERENALRPIMKSSKAPRSRADLAQTQLRPGSVAHSSSADVTIDFFHAPTVEKTQVSPRLTFQLNEDGLEGLVSQILRQVFECLFKGNNRAGLEGVSLVVGGERRLN